MICMNPPMPQRFPGGAGPTNSLCPRLHVHPMTASRTTPTDINEPARSSEQRDDHVGSPFSPRRRLDRLRTFDGVPVLVGDGSPCCRRATLPAREGRLGQYEHAHAALPSEYRE